MISSEVDTNTVTVGVVDTGIDVSCSIFGRRTVQGIAVQRIGVDEYCYESDFRDFSGHGTAMAAEICAFCEAANIYAVRIAQQEGVAVAVRVQEQALAMGIEWCIDQRIRIVNVSYNIAEASDEGFLCKVCRKAHENGTILVAAYRNGEEMPVYPAAFPTVIGVRHRDDLEPPEMSVFSEENLDLFAWGASNSMATAHVSAMVGRIHTIDDSLRLETVFAYLMEVAVEQSLVSAPNLA